MKNKKIITAILVLFTMVISLMPMTAMAAVTATEHYFDVNFDSETVGAATTWTNTAGVECKTTVTTYSHYFGTTTTEVAYDDVKDSNVLKYNIPAPPYNAAGHLRAGALATTDTFDNTGIVWTEFSIKYNTAVVSTQVGIAGGIAMYVGNDGSVILGNSTTSGGGKAVSGLTLKVGEWYHCTVAVDFKNTGVASSTQTNQPKMYVYLNGEMITTGVWSGISHYLRSYNASTALVTPGAALYIGAGADTTVPHTVYVDDFKSYATADTELANFDPEDCYDGAILSDSMLAEGMSVDDDTIYVDGNATIKDVKDGITTTAKITSSYNDTVLAIGKTINVVSDNGGVKEYKIARKNAYSYADTKYYNVNFDADGETTTSFTNTGTGNFSTQKWNASNNFTNTEIYADNFKNSKVFRASEETQVPVAYELYGDTTVSAGDTLWFESSMKFEGAIGSPQFYMAGVGLAIIEKGEFYVGNVAVNNGAVKVINFTPELNKWYHFVFALDTTRSYPTLYVWANGELLLTKADLSYTVQLPGATAPHFTFDETTTSKSGRTSIKYYPGTAATGRFTSFDDFKCYKTTDSVASWLESGYFDAVAEYAIFDKEEMNVVGEKLFLADTDATIADIAGGIVGGDVIDAEGNDISAKTDVALGNVIYVRSNEGIGVLELEVAGKMSYTVDSVDLSDASAPKITVTNTTPGEKNVSFVIAAYDEDGNVKKLVDAVSKSGKVAWETNDITFNEIDLTGADSYRLFVWDSLSKLVPVFNIAPQAIN